MAHHTITVSFFDGRVRAVPNPLPARGGIPPQVRPGDTVTWMITEDRPLQVLFSTVLTLDSQGNPTGSQTTNPWGPFNSLSYGARVIVGTVHSDVSQDITRATRYLYKLYEDGVSLQWDQVVPGGDVINGGGIDTPRTPP